MKGTHAPIMYMGLQFLGQLGSKLKVVIMLYIHQLFMIYVPLCTLFRHQHAPSATNATSEVFDHMGFHAFVLKSLLFSALSELVRILPLSGRIY